MDRCVLQTHAQNVFYVCIVATITPAYGICKCYLKQIAEQSQVSGNKFVLSKTNSTENT